jgi:hypothetical protein
MRCVPELTEPPMATEKPSVPSASELTEPPMATDSVTNPPAVLTDAPAADTSDGFVLSLFVGLIFIAPVFFLSL